MLFSFATVVALLASFATAVPCTGHGDIIDKCTISGTVALTFDDGPRGKNYERAIADTIASHGDGRATFFINGDNYGCIYDQENVDTLRYLYEKGHVIGSHTWSHADITKLSYEGVSQELEKLETAMVKILGVKPKYFRPPYGNYNQNAVNVLKDRGYSKIWLWDVDSGDSLNASPDQQKNTLNGAANSYPQPHLILQHSVQDKTPDVVSDTTPNFQSKGYRMVTVNKCIPGAEDWPYTWVGNYGTRDSSWHC